MIGQPIVDSREAETTLLIKSGQTVVLGGMRKKETTDDRAHESAYATRTANFDCIFLFRRAGFEAHGIGVETKIWAGQGR